VSSTGTSGRFSATDLLPALAVLAALGLWELAAGALGEQRLPSLGSLWPAVIDNLHENDILEFQGGGSDGIWPHLRYTIEQTLLGSAIGVVVGVGIGLVMTRWALARGLLDVPIQVLRTVPPLAAIPFLLIWFGPTRTAQLGLVAFYVAVMMVVTTVNAVGNLEPVYRRYALTLGASENRVFRSVVLPAILPDITGGIRVAVGVAWGIEVVSELAGAREGMGQVFNKMISFQGLDVIVIGIFWVTVAAVIADLLLLLIVRRATRWTPANQ
jgi:ABC-type nitrate/sulfonate/bicarbonate transport system permease component